MTEKRKIMMTDYELLNQQLAALLYHTLPHLN